MDEKEQIIFKGKFTLCVVLLNITIFSFAIAICILAIVDNGYWFKLPAVVLSILIFILSILSFSFRYKATKIWLNIHGVTKEERIAREKEKEEEYRARIRAEIEEEMRDDQERGGSVVNYSK